MKTIRYLITLTVVAAFVLSGCAREPYNTIPLYEMVDADGDGIPDQYDYPNNTATKEIACELPSGATTYLDCTTTADCNCNQIPDNEEADTTEKCGWGCVSNRYRTYIIASSVLIGAYLGYQAYVHWPRDDKTYEKDSEGNIIEYVEVKSYPSVNDSYLQFTLESVGGTPMIMMTIHIEGTCTSNTYPNGFWCGFELKNQVDNFSPALPTNSAVFNDASGITQIISNMYYSYNMAQSPVENKNQQYIKVFDSRMNRWEYVKDPKWIGLNTTKEGPNMVPIRLANRIDCGDCAFFSDLYFNLNDPSHFVLNSGSNNEPEGHYLFDSKLWNRSE